jgi:DnaJ-class molecular chaperone
LYLKNPRASASVFPPGKATTWSSRCRFRCREAVFGGKIDVPGLDETLSVTVPPGVSSGQRLRIRGHGFPIPGSNQRGDLYVELRIVLPKHLDPESRRLLEEFARRNPYNPRSEMRL